MSFSTCDLCDANEAEFASGALQVLAPGWLQFGARTRFAGPAATLKVFEDNVLVRSALESPGRGRVLVVDAGASLRCGMVGGNLAALAEKNHWAGILVHGCVRDVEELARCEIGIRALGIHPRRSARLGAGSVDVAVQLGAARVRPGDWIYADADGTLISQHALLPLDQLADSMSGGAAGSD